MIWDYLKGLGPAMPVFIVAVFLILHARWRYRTRFERGNGRPAVPCRICGKKHQRGLPLQLHMDKDHGMKKGKRQ